MNFKRKLIHEMKDMLEREKISLEDFFEMLEFASTVELSLFKSNLQKLLRLWKETRKDRKTLFLH